MTVRPTLVAAQGSGRIATIGSDSSRALPRGGASKGAVNSLTVALARDGITVNCVSPGSVDTRMLRAGDPAAPGQLEKIPRTVPLRRLAAPAEIAAAVGFLLSEEASYVTTQIIPVNGGALAG